jgi:N-methylhydantoinase A/oxoprolinase/acetone carboxylase beta subunit
VRIGIDVGGTNTDTVLLDGTHVLASVKTSTSADVTSGIDAAIDGLRRQYTFDESDVQAVMIGTTHFINALVEGRGLAPTAALRLGLPAGASIPPLTGWPPRLVEAIAGRSYQVHGGHEFDGRHIAELDEAELRAAAEDMGRVGVRSVAISSVFSPLNAEFETRAAAVIADVLPDIAISLSHEVGRIGLLERENATIINASLRELAAHIVDGLGRAVARTAGITAPLYLSQNDGTVMDVDFARRYPVATFTSGPTNSMRGAAVLSGLTSCAVIDVGGTTTDVGVIHEGFPREALDDVRVAGIRTNFRMPDVLSLGIGGGSIVRGTPGDITVGPDSVGFRLTSRALVFGGDTLTATDIAVAAGLADIGDASLVRHLDAKIVGAALEHIAAAAVDAVDRMRTSAAPLPVVAVGGGAMLLPDRFADEVATHHPEHASVANAIGAAIAQIGAEVDRIYTIDPGRRAAVIDEAKQEAMDRAVAAGADPATIAIVELDEVPLAYISRSSTRIRVKAVGDLQLSPPRASGAQKGEIDA